MNRKDLITIRDAKSSDKNFILATWLRGLYYGDSWFKDIPKNIFMEYYHRHLEDLILLPGVVIKVACLKEDEDVILGYAVTRFEQNQNILDWIFVKAAWRRIGIGKSLVPKDLTVVTHLTAVGKSLKPSAVVFNPFI